MAQIASLQKTGYYNPETGSLFKIELTDGREGEVTTDSLMSTYSPELDGCEAEWEFEVVLVGKTWDEDLTEELLSK